MFLGLQTGLDATTHAQGFTVTVTSREVNNCPSLAVARSTYVPGTLKLAFDVSVTGCPWMTGLASG